MLFQTVFNFFPGLGDVNVDLEALVPGPLRRADKLCSTDSVHRMRGDRESDPASGRVDEMIDEIDLAVFHSLGVVVHHGDSDAGADSERIDKPDGAIYSEIHVIEEYGTSADHFPDGSLAPPLDVFVGQRVFVGPDVVLKPLLEWEVVCIAAKQGHCGMTMGVVEGRKDCKTLCLNDLSSRIVVRDTDLADYSPINEYVGAPAAEQHVANQNAHGQR